jgi:hypothetical protein
MTRTKKFASKPKFRGSKYVCVNKDTGVSEKGQPLSYQRGKSGCVKHNLTASNKKVHGTSVNTEIKIGKNNICQSESNFTHDRNILVIINLLFTLIRKNNNCKHCDGNIPFLKIHQSGEVLEAM